MISQFRDIAFVALLLPTCFHGTLVDASDADAWQAFAEGRAVLLMRHALAPGISDPANFDIEDCTTQRNLSDAGREQAVSIGEQLIDRLGPDVQTDVFSSAWCRCMETGELLGFNTVEVLPPLNSFFRDRAQAESQTEALQQWIDARLAEANRPAILVTHQVNVTAVTGVFPTSGEAVLVDADGEVLLQSLLSEPLPE